ncbi:CCA tRNA nucleotidyltransferase [Synechococcus sp. C9]|jgi:tRNA nucleotidyltransferase (CCA-adding enzyme)|uniref:CCA tRNA nucleotidyltransferase n=1 Tax=Synechococcus sp. C9 TaxID=102119 RepID=UPI001FF5E243|nr:CCA tRNA nucleotidyltransferase [Synechococcus sp. C9]
MSDLHPFEPKTWPFHLTDLPPGGYLVGGAVRDGLLHRHKKHWDLDIILAVDVIPFAQKLAQKYHAGFVILDAERQIARLVFPELTLDLCQMYGEDITTDLSQRDFTINAIAWDYHTQELHDPHQGQNDLENQIIRMIQPQNLRHDPLRLLRAYRLAAQLNFTIESETHQTIKNLASLLINVAPERVQNELHLLFDTHRGSNHLIQASADGILTPWFPEIQPHWLHLLPRWDERLSAYPALAPQLERKIRQDRSVLHQLKLRCLLPEHRETAQQILTRLRYSRAEMQYIDKLIALWPVFELLITSPNPPIPAQFDLFQQAGQALPGLVAVALVHDYGWPVVAGWLERFTNPQDPIAHALPLVSGHDLMERLHLPPGPQVGQLLHWLALAHAEGRICTPTAALELAATLQGTTPAPSA